MRTSRHDCLPDECRCELCPECSEWAHQEDQIAIPVVGWLCRGCARGWTMGPLDLSATLAAERQHIDDVLGFDPFRGYPALLEEWRAAVSSGGRRAGLPVLARLGEERRANRGPEPKILRRGAA